MRLGDRDFGETQVIAGAELCGYREVDGNHLCNFRITANCLAISQKQNRHSARWNLDRARGDCFGHKIEPLPARRATHWFNRLGCPALSIWLTRPCTQSLLKKLPGFSGFGDIVCSTQFGSSQPRQPCCGPEIDNSSPAETSVECPAGIERNATEAL